MRRSLHDDITREISRKRAIHSQYALELFKFLFLRQSSEQQQKGSPFVTKTLSAVHPDKILHLIASVPQLSVTRYAFAVISFLKCIDLGYIGKSGKYSLTVYVSKSAVNSELSKKLICNGIILNKNRSHLICIISHRLCVAHLVLLSDMLIEMLMIISEMNM